MKLFLFFMGLFLIGTIASACPCAPPPHHPPSGSNYWKGCVTVPRYGPTSCSNTTYCQLCSRDDDNVEHCYDLGETTGDLYTCFANYNFGNPEEPKDPVVNHPKYQCGSIINANQLTVGESIPIVGSDISLNYFTDRVPGYNHLYTFTQHIDPGLNETNLEKIHVTNTWLGVDNVTTYDPASEVEDLVFNWDGKDHQDQEVIASITTEIKVEYEYAGSIIQTQFITSATVGTYQAKAIGLGGWTLSNVHYLEKNRNTIYYGNGRSASVAPFKVNVNSNGEIERLANNNIFSNYLVSKEDKSEVYLFDLDGYHIETRSSRTNEVLLTINWNNGLLQSIEDSFGNITALVNLETSLPLLLLIKSKLKLYLMLKAGLLK